MKRIVGLAPCTAVALLFFGLMFAVAGPTRPAVPLYGYQADEDGINERLDTILAELAALRRDVAELKAAGKDRHTAGPDALAIAQRSCLRCHGPSTADDDGGGFTLFTDDAGSSIVKLSGRERQRAADRVSAGTMPPRPSRLSAADKSSLFEYLRK